MLLCPALVFYSSIGCVALLYFDIKPELWAHKLRKPFCAVSYKTCVLSSTTASVSTVLFTAASVW